MADDVPCPDAVYDRQPYPGEMADVFDQAGTDRLGTAGPELPQIWKGYPPAEAELVSPYVPCILLKAIGYTESTGWKQFEAEYDQSGYTVLNEYLNGTCDIGVMQIHTNTADEAGLDLDLLAGDYTYNIGGGARVLIDKWNVRSNYIGNRDPHVVEDWYYAVWAYNRWGWYNNPNNDRLDPY